jgi:chorismate lyase/3-hydroxybenzoate synthase
MNLRHNQHLRIELTDSISPPTAEHNLLIAFRFGEKPAAQDHPAVVDTHLDTVDHDCLYECWWIAEPVTYRGTGISRISECDAYAVVVQDNDESEGENLEKLTYNAYIDLLGAVRSTGHKQIAKIWNYLGGINEGDGDLERYRRFSVGRAAAFTDMAVADTSAPAATGVGTRRDFGLTIIALASKHSLQLSENPRQLSAFRYPRQYGPSSPKFARGGIVANDRHHLNILSGTAAIVGHESVHPYDVDSQVDETFRNLSALNETVNVIDRNSVLRVYLRNPDDHSVVAQKLANQFGLGSDRVAYLRGNICRRELVVEIDGVRIQ